MYCKFSCLPVFTVQSLENLCLALLAIRCLLSHCRDKAGQGSIGRVVQLMQAKIWKKVWQVLEEGCFNEISRYFQDATVHKIPHLPSVLQIILDPLNDGKSDVGLVETEGEISNLLLVRLDPQDGDE